MASEAGFSYAGHFAGERNVAAHRHQGLELVLCVSGECVHRVGDVDFAAGPGMLLAVPPETPHIQLNRGPVETDYVVFFAPDAVFPSRLRCIDTGGDRLIGRWMQDLTRLRPGLEPVQADALLRALLDRVRGIEERRNLDVRRHPALAQAVRLIHARFAENLTAGGIAAAAGVSPSYLNALFNREFGHGPLKHLQEVRLAHARELLANPYLTVAEVGIRSGYEEPYYFCRIFRRVFHCSPGAYRRRLF